MPAVIDDAIAIAWENVTLEDALAKLNQPNVHSCATKKKQKYDHTNCLNFNEN